MVIQGINRPVSFLSGGDSAHHKVRMTTLANQNRLVSILKHLRDDKTNPYVAPFYVCAAPISRQVGELMNRRISATEFASALEKLGYVQVPGNRPNINSVFTTNATHLSDKSTVFINIDYSYLLDSHTALETLRKLVELYEYNAA